MIWPLLKTRRWLGFSVVVAIAIAAFGLLSAWQWSRAEQHRNERIALDAALASAPRDVNDSPLTEWTPVVVAGTYDESAQVVVRKRPLEGKNGFWLMTPLISDAGPTVWVNRGWLPVTGDALATPALPAPPSGTVTVTGYARALEAGDPADNDGLPPGQVAAPARDLLPVLPGSIEQYVQLTTSDPAQDGLVTLPLPTVTVDEGRNISYAVQWLLFALVAVAGWYFFLRREAREEAAREAKEAEPWISA